MQRILATSFALLLLFLAGCGDDINPVIGKWRGKITDEQLKGLLLSEGEEDGFLIAEFTDTFAKLNGLTYRVEHKRNQGTYYVNEIGTNRAMAIQFLESGVMKLGVPHRFKAEIIDLSMIKVPVNDQSTGQ